MLLSIIFCFSFALEDKTYALQNEVIISSQLDQQAPKTEVQYVFVAGFLNEAVPSYFSENIEYLKKIGVKEKFISSHFPTSNTDIKDNVEELFYFLDNLAADRPLVLIAHSKGAAVALFLKARYTKWFESKVKHLYLVQAAFGSPIADFSNGNGEEIDHRLPFFQRWNCYLSLYAKHFLEPFLQTGVNELVESRMSEYLDEFLRPHNESTTFEKDLTFITSETQDIARSLILNCTSAYLLTYYNENDGLVLLRNQKPERFNARHWHFNNYDHLAFVIAKPFSGNTKRLRYAFTSMLVKDIKEILNERY